MDTTCPSLVFLKTSNGASVLVMMGESRDKLGQGIQHRLTKTPVCWGSCEVQPKQEGRAPVPAHKTWREAEASTCRVKIILVSISAN